MNVTPPPRASCAASAMAFSNSLDLRPATAAPVSSPSMTGGMGGLGRGGDMGLGGGLGGRGMSMGMDMHGGGHHAIIKQVRRWAVRGPCGLCVYRLCVWAVGGLCGLCGLCVYGLAGWHVMSRREVLST